MKKKVLLPVLAALLAGCLFAQAGEQAFEKAKVLIFDRQWPAALKQLESVIAAGPRSRHYPAALFYRAKCQEEMGARQPALESYERFIATQAAGNLAEDARVSIIDLAAGLYQDGEKAYLAKITGLLRDRNKVVSYYAAFKLSYLPDRGPARQALPVLGAILENEKDGELRDRARIAIMRVDPSRLKDGSAGRSRPAGQTLMIRIFDKKRKEAAVVLNLPMALADLALRSLSAEQKRSLRRQGFDLDDVLARLTREGLKIDFQDEDGAFQIWVE